MSSGQELFGRRDVRTTMIYGRRSQPIWIDCHAVRAVGESGKRSLPRAAVLSGVNILRDPAVLLDNLVLHDLRHDLRQSTTGAFGYEGLIS